MLRDKVISLDLNIYYEQYSEMAESHGFPPMPLVTIDEMLAYVEDGEILYTCFVWNAGSVMSIIGFPVSNLKVDYSKRKGKLNEFIKGIVEYCKNKGSMIVWTTSGTDRVIDSLDSNGFILGDKNVNLYLNYIN